MSNIKDYLIFKITSCFILSCFLVTSILNNYTFAATVSPIKDVSTFEQLTKGVDISSLGKAEEDTIYRGAREYVWTMRQKYYESSNRLVQQNKSDNTDLDNITAKTKQDIKNYYKSIIDQSQSTYVTTRNNSVNSFNEQRLRLNLLYSDKINQLNENINQFQNLLVKAQSITDLNQSDIDSVNNAADSLTPFTDFLGSLGITQMQEVSQNLETFKNATAPGNLVRKQEYIDYINKRISALTDLNNSLIKAQQEKDAQIQSMEKQSLADIDSANKKHIADLAAEEESRLVEADANIAAQKSSLKQQLQINLDNLHAETENIITNYLNGQQGVFTNAMMQAEKTPLGSLSVDESLTGVKQQYTDRGSSGYIGDIENYRDVTDRQSVYQGNLYLDKAKGALLSGSSDSVLRSKEYASAAGMTDKNVNIVMPKNFADVNLNQGPIDVNLNLGKEITAPKGDTGLKSVIDDGTRKIFDTADNMINENKQVIKNIESNMENTQAQIKSIRNSEESKYNQNMINAQAEERQRLIDFVDELSSTLDMLYPNLDSEIASLDKAIQETSVSRNASSEGIGIGTVFVAAGIAGMVMIIVGMVSAYATGVLAPVGVVFGIIGITLALVSITWGIWSLVAVASEEVGLRNAYDDACLNSSNIETSLYNPNTPDVAAAYAAYLAAQKEYEKKMSEYKIKITQLMGGYSGVINKKILINKIKKLIAKKSTGNFGPDDLRNLDNLLFNFKDLSNNAEFKNINSKLKQELENLNNAIERMKQTGSVTVKITEVVDGVVAVHDVTYTNAWEAFQAMQLWSSVASTIGVQELDANGNPTGRFTGGWLSRFYDGSAQSDYTNAYHLLLQSQKNVDDAFKTWTDAQDNLINEHTDWTQEAKDTARIFADLLPGLFKGLITFGMQIGMMPLSIAKGYARGGLEGTGEFFTGLITFGVDVVAPLIGLRPGIITELVNYGAPQATLDRDKDRNVTGWNNNVFRVEYVDIGQAIASIFLIVSGFLAGNIGKSVSVYKAALGRGLSASEALKLANKALYNAGFIGKVIKIAKAIFTKGIKVFFKSIFKWIAKNLNPKNLSKLGSKIKGYIKNHPVKFALGVTIIAGGGIALGLGLGLGTSIASGGSIAGIGNIIGIVSAYVVGSAIIFTKISSFASKVKNSKIFKMENGKEVVDAKGNKSVLEKGTMAAYFDNTVIKGLREKNLKWAQKVIQAWDENKRGLAVREYIGARLKLAFFKILPKGLKESSSKYLGHTADLLFGKKSATGEWLVKPNKALAYTRYILAPIAMPLKYLVMEKLLGGRDTASKLNKSIRDSIKGYAKNIEALSSDNFQGHKALAVAAAIATPLAVIPDIFVGIGKGISKGYLAAKEAALRSRIEAKLEKGIIIVDGGRNIVRPLSVIEKDSIIKIYNDAYSAKGKGYKQAVSLVNMELNRLGVEDIGNIKAVNPFNQVLSRTFLGMEGYALKQKGEMKGSAFLFALRRMFVGTDIALALASGKKVSAKKQAGLLFQRLYNFGSAGIGTSTGLVMKSLTIVAFISMPQLLLAAILLKGFTRMFGSTLSSKTETLNNSVKDRMNLGKSQGSAETVLSIESNPRDMQLLKEVIDNNRVIRDFKKMTSEQFNRKLVNGEFGKEITFEYQLKRRKITIEIKSEQLEQFRDYQIPNYFAGKTTYSLSEIKNELNSNKELLRARNENIEQILKRDMLPTALMDQYKGYKEQDVRSIFVTEQVLNTARMNIIDKSLNYLQLEEYRRMNRQSLFKNMNNVVIPSTESVKKLELNKKSLAEIMKETENLEKELKSAKESSKNNNEQLVLTGNLENMLGAYKNMQQVYTQLEDITKVWVSKFSSQELREMKNYYENKITADTGYASMKDGVIFGVINNELKLRVTSEDYLYNKINLCAINKTFLNRSEWNNVNQEYNNAKKELSLFRLKKQFYSNLFNGATMQIMKNRDMRQQQEFWKDESSKYKDSIKKIGEKITDMESRGNIYLAQLDQYSQQILKINKSVAKAIKNYNDKILKESASSIILRVQQTIALSKYMSIENVEKKIEDKTNELSLTKDEYARNLILCELDVLAKIKLFKKTFQENLEKQGIDILSKKGAQKANKDFNNQIKALEKNLIKKFTLEQNMEKTFKKVMPGELILVQGVENPLKVNRQKNEENLVKVDKEIFKIINGKSYRQALKGTVKSVLEKEGGFIDAIFTSNIVKDFNSFNIEDMPLEQLKNKIDNMEQFIVLLKGNIDKAQKEIDKYTGEGDKMFFLKKWHRGNKAILLEAKEVARRKKVLEDFRDYLTLQMKKVYEIHNDKLESNEKKIGVDIETKLRQTAGNIPNNFQIELETRLQEIDKMTDVQKANLMAEIEKKMRDANTKIKDYFKNKTLNDLSNVNANEVSSMMKEFIELKITKTTLKKSEYYGPKTKEESLKQTSEAKRAELAKQISEMQKEFFNQVEVKEFSDTSYIRKNITDKINQINTEFAYRYNRTIIKTGWDSATELPKGLNGNKLRQEMSKYILKDKQKAISALTETFGGISNIRGEREAELINAFNKVPMRKPRVGKEIQRAMLEEKKVIKMEDPNSAIIERLANIPGIEDVLDLYKEDVKGFLQEELKKLDLRGNKTEALNGLLSNVKKAQEDFLKNVSNSEAQKNITNSKSYRDIRESIMILENRQKQLAQEGKAFTENQTAFLNYLKSEIVVRELNNLALVVESVKLYDKRGKEIEKIGKKIFHEGWRERHLVGNLGPRVLDVIIEELVKKDPKIDREAAKKKWQDVINDFGKFNTTYEHAKELMELYDGMSKPTNDFKEFVDIYATMTGAILEIKTNAIVKIVKGPDGKPELKSNTPNYNEHTNLKMQIDEMYKFLHRDILKQSKEYFDMLENAHRPYYEKFKEIVEKGIASNKVKTEKGETPSFATMDFEKVLEALQGKDKDYIIKETFGVSNLTEMTPLMWKVYDIILTKVKESAGSKEIINGKEENLAGRDIAVNNPGFKIGQDQLINAGVAEIFEQPMQAATGSGKTIIYNLLAGRKALEREMNNQPAQTKYQVYQEGEVGQLQRSMAPKKLSEGIYGGGFLEKFYDVKLLNYKELDEAGILIKTLEDMTKRNEKIFLVMTHEQAGHAINKIMDNPKYRLIRQIPNVVIDELHTLITSTVATIVGSRLSASIAEIDSVQRVFKSIYELEGLLGKTLDYEKLVKEGIGTYEINWLVEQLKNTEGYKAMLVGKEDQIKGDVMVVLRARKEFMGREVVGGVAKANEITGVVASLRDGQPKALIATQLLALAKRTGKMQLLKEGKLSSVDLIIERSNTVQKSTLLETLEFDPGISVPAWRIAGTGTVPPEGVKASFGVEVRGTGSSSFANYPIDIVVEKNGKKLEQNVNTGKMVESASTIEDYAAKTVVEARNNGMAGFIRTDNEHLRQQAVSVLIELENSNRTKILEKLNKRTQEENVKTAEFIQKIEDIKKLLNENNTAGLIQKLDESITLLNKNRAESIRRLDKSIEAENARIKERIEKLNKSIESEKPINLENIKKLRERINVENARSAEIVKKFEDRKKLADTKNAELIQKLEDSKRLANTNNIEFIKKLEETKTLLTANNKENIEKLQEDSNMELGNASTGNVISAIEIINRLTQNNERLAYINLTKPELLKKEGLFVDPIMLDETKPGGTITLDKLIDNGIVKYENGKFIVPSEKNREFIPSLMDVITSKKGIMEIMKADNSILSKLEFDGKKIMRKGADGSTIIRQDLFDQLIDPISEQLSKVYVFDMHTNTPEISDIAKEAMKEKNILVSNLQIGVGIDVRGAVAQVSRIDLAQQSLLQLLGRSRRGYWKHEGYTQAVLDLSVLKKRFKDAAKAFKEEVKFLEKEKKDISEKKYLPKAEQDKYIANLDKKIKKNRNMAIDLERRLENIKKGTELTNPSVLKDIVYLNSNLLSMLEQQDSVLFKASETFPLERELSNMMARAKELGFDGDVKTIKTILDKIRNLTGAGGGKIVRPEKEKWEAPMTGVFTRVKDLIEQAKQINQKLLTGSQIKEKIGLGFMRLLNKNFTEKPIERVDSVELQRELEIFVRSITSVQKEIKTDIANLSLEELKAKLEKEATVSYAEINNSENPYRSWYLTSVYECVKNMSIPEYEKIKDIESKSVLTTDSVSQRIYTGSRFGILGFGKAMTANSDEAGTLVKALNRKLSNNDRVILTEKQIEGITRNRLAWKEWEWMINKKSAKLFVTLNNGNICLVPTQSVQNYSNAENRALLKFQLEIKPAYDVPYEERDLSEDLKKIEKSKDLEELEKPVVLIERVRREISELNSINKAGTIILPYLKSMMEDDKYKDNFIMQLQSVFQAQTKNSKQKISMIINEKNDKEWMKVAGINPTIELVATNNEDVRVAYSEFQQVQREQQFDIIRQLDQKVGKQVTESVPCIDLKNDIVFSKYKQINDKLAPMQKNMKKLESDKKNLEKKEKSMEPLDFEKQMKDLDASIEKQRKSLDPVKKQKQKYRDFFVTHKGYAAYFNPLLRQIGEKERINKIKENVVINMPSKDFVSDMTEYLTYRYEEKFGNQIIGPQRITISSQGRVVDVLVKNDEATKYVSINKELDKDINFEENKIQAINSKNAKKIIDDINTKITDFQKPKTSSKDQDQDLLKTVSAPTPEPITKAFIVELDSIKDQKVLHEVVTEIYKNPLYQERVVLSQNGYLFSKNKKLNDEIQKRNPEDSVLLKIFESNRVIKNAKKDSKKVFRLSYIKQSVGAVIDIPEKVQKAEAKSAQDEYFNPVIAAEKELRDAVKVEDKEISRSENVIRNMNEKNAQGWIYRALNKIIDKAKNDNDYRKELLQSIGFDKSKEMQGMGKDESGNFQFMFMKQDEGDRIIITVFDANSLSKPEKMEEFRQYLTYLEVQNRRYNKTIEVRFSSIATDSDKEVVNNVLSFIGKTKLYDYLLPDVKRSNVEVTLKGQLLGTNMNDDNIFVKDFADTFKDKKVYEMPKEAMKNAAALNSWWNDAIKMSPETSDIIIALPVGKKLNDEIKTFLNNISEKCGTVYAVDTSGKILAASASTVIIAPNAKIETLKKYNKQVVVVDEDKVKNMVTVTINSPIITEEIKKSVEENKDKFINKKVVLKVRDAVFNTNAVVQDFNKSFKISEIEIINDKGDTVSTLRYEYFNGKGFCIYNFKHHVDFVTFMSDLLEKESDLSKYPVIFNVEEEVTKDEFEKTYRSIMNGFVLDNKLGNVIITSKLVKKDSNQNNVIVNSVLASNVDNVKGEIDLEKPKQSLQLQSVPEDEASRKSLRDVVGMNTDISVDVVPSGMVSVYSEGGIIAYPMQTEAYRKAIISMQAFKETRGLQKAIDSARSFASHAVQNGKNVFNTFTQAGSRKVEDFENLRAIEQLQNAK
jgi:hypothetical protein